MSRYPFILLAVLYMFNDVLADDAHQTASTEKPSDILERKDSIPHEPSEVVKPQSTESELQHLNKLHPEVDDAENQQSDLHQPKVQPSEVQEPGVKLSEVQNSAAHHEEDHNHHVEKHQEEEHHHKEQHAEVHSTDTRHPDEDSKKQVPTGRQFHPPPYHPMLFQPPSGFEAIRRQFGGGLGSDLVMVGLISLPIIGLLTMGSASLGNLFGLGLSSNSKKSSSKRTKRSLKEKAADAVEYAKDLWNVMEQLEKAFEQYDLYQAECRLRVVCEAHHKDRRMGSWGQSILNLMRQQKELESRELLPVSRFLFSNYAEAAQAGARNENCTQLYTGCPRHLSYYLSAKEDQTENEVEIGK